MKLHIRKIKPLLTDIITTADKYEEDVTTGGIITDKNETKGWVKDYQVVVAVGPLVRGIEVGDKVAISFKNYEVKKYNNSVKEDMGMQEIIGYNLPCVIQDDENGEQKEFLRITEKDVMYVFEGEEEPDSSIILPDKPKIIIN